MIALFIATIVTLGLILFHRIIKENHKPFYYVGLFFFFFIINLVGQYFIESSKAHSAEIIEEEFVLDAQEEIEYLQLIHSLTRDLTKQQKKQYQEKTKFHYLQAEKYFSQAKNQAWYLPNWSEREKAVYCFNSVMTGIGPGNLYSKAIATLIQWLAYYGLTTISQWNEMRTNLRWAQYHYEMYEWYANVQNNG